MEHTLMYDETHAMKHFYVMKPVLSHETHAMSWNGRLGRVKSTYTMKPMLQYVMKHNLTMKPVSYQTQ